MKSCFLLWHRRTVEDDDDSLLVGVHLTSDDAKAAMQRVQDTKAFKDYPGGFERAEYTIGQDHWAEGFVIGEGAS